MHIAVREKPDKMEHTIIGLDVGYKLFPGVASKHTASRNGVRYQLGSLGKDPAAPHCVVPHLAISHVGVRWEPHRGAVSFKLGVGAVGCKPVQICHTACLHCIAIGILAIAHAIHDHQNYRSPASFPVFISLKRFYTLSHITPHFSTRRTYAENPSPLVVI